MPRWIDYAPSPRVSTRLLLSMGLAVSGLVAGTACEPKDDGSNKPVAAADYPRRAGVAFVRCVESTGGQCVEMSESIGAWDAFSVLGWLASGSPVGILQRLPSELRHHSDRNLVLRRFTNAANAMQRPLRGAECDAESVIELGPLVDELEKAASARLQRIGIWSADLDAVVKGLAKESRGLQGGYLVEMRCLSEPFGFYVATAADGDRQLAVGLMSGLPDFLGGTAPPREAVERNLKSIEIEADASLTDSNLVHPWIPVAPEGF